MQKLVSADYLTWELYVDYENKGLKRVLFVIVTLLRQHVLMYGSTPLYTWE